MVMLSRKQVPENIKYLQETQMVGAFLAIGIHIIYIILFAVYKVNALLWFNILISLPVFIIAFYLSYTGNLKLPPLIGTIEVAIHQTLAVLLIGQETGFHILLFCLVPVGMLFKKWKVSFFINSIIALVLYICILWFDTGNFIIYKITAPSLKLIRLVNSLGLYTIVGLIIFYYITLYNKLFNKQLVTNERLKEFNEKLNVAVEILNVQKDKIESQHHILIEQNENITKSINYASRIQTAIMPQKEVLEKTLPDHFILFVPKEIVSGDFYWISQVDQKVVFCVADCTGHGVPGAFMSLLGIAFLDEIVNKRKILTPNEILNNLRSEVINSLKQTGKREEQKDGMDITLCIYDKSNSQLSYAGAYNPLYLIHNQELVEFKADNIPICYLEDNSASFKMITVNINKDDIVYLFSDGYTDQFGGEDCVRYKHEPLKLYLQKIHKLPMSRQRILLEQNFNLWKGDKEQTDDVILMGVRF
jgi:serine phosphatase RsbU (regulator of sigma subunit)